MQLKIKKAITHFAQVKHIQKGFTLIELMIVVAIIGILASIALPAYQTYVAKSMTTSILATAATGKTPIFQYYIDNGEMPQDGAFTTNSDLKAFDEAMKTTGIVTYRRTGPTLMFFRVELEGINGNVNGKYMWFWYEDNGDELSMRCTAHWAVNNKYLPKQCYR